ncbi:MAG: Co-chaperone protein HscB [Holosporales bacterium]
MDNPFALLNVPLALMINKSQLDTNYQNLQRRLHPDVQTDPLQRQAAEILAANVAKAYNQIQDPLFCLQFLLNSRGESLEKIEQDKTFLMEILQIQEQIEEKRDLDTLYKTLQNQVDLIAQNIEKLYRDQACFNNEALKFSYFFKILKRLSNGDKEFLQLSLIQ